MPRWFSIGSRTKSPRFGMGLTLMATRADFLLAPTPPTFVHERRRDEMATASVGRPDKGSSRGSHAFRAPLQRARLAIAGQGRGDEKPKASQPAPALKAGANVNEPEIENLRNMVHCAALLERTTPPWKLDRRIARAQPEISAWKGEILIVSHGGRGWWDPTSDAKGDVFGLVQRLEPGINFGHVRKRLRDSRDYRRAFQCRKGRAPRS